ncbi:MAG: hypothetical protein M3R24_12910 [Chloroflexota bacterium]|nr:hypothetical protein [Chloroflexota bacterium]
MISRDEYERVIESFMMEMQAMCAGLRASDLQQLPRFVQELQEAKLLLCNPTPADEDLVGYAFGILDEFVHAAWTTVMQDSYALYVALSGDKGQSPGVHSAGS